MALWSQCRPHVRPASEATVTGGGADVAGAMSARARDRRRSRAQSAALPRPALARGSQNWSRGVRRGAALVGGRGMLPCPSARVAKQMGGGAAARRDRRLPPMGSAAGWRRPTHGPLCRRCGAGDAGQRQQPAAAAGRGWTRRERRRGETRAGPAQRAAGAAAAARQHAGQRAQRSGWPRRRGRARGGAGAASGRARGAARGQRTTGDRRLGGSRGWRVAPPLHRCQRRPLEWRPRRSSAAPPGGAHQRRRGTLPRPAAAGGGSTGRRRRGVEASPRQPADGQRRGRLSPHGGSHLPAPQQPGTPPRTRTPPREAL